MLYRLFVYRCLDATGKACVDSYINAAISLHSEKEWRDNLAANNMEEFDVEAVKAQIIRELGDKCKIYVKYPPKDCRQVPYLSIPTSYARAREVLPRLSIIVAERGLSLYDAQTDRGFVQDLVDETLIQLKFREQAVKNRIFHENQPIWNFSQIYSFEDHLYRESAFVVTLRKMRGVSFQERTLQFYNTLENALSEGETLCCENRCFRISRDDYAMIFCLEGYKKHPNMIGFCEKGKPCAEVLFRMGCVEAMKWMRQCTKIERADIQSRMYFREMIGRYPNPADRFVRSINITKGQRKEWFLLRYSDIGYYADEILFHIKPDEYVHDEKFISVLKIQEESASFLLPFIADIYPYINMRHYDLNCLPMEMWADIIKRLSEAKEMILRDTFNYKLRPYIDKFAVFLLDNSNTVNFPQKADREQILQEKTRIVFQQRYKVARLYDLFIEWSNLQMEYYGFDSDRMFIIQGP